MRRDLDLVRWILLKLEKDPLGPLQLTDRTEAEIHYHLGLLHREGLVDAHHVTSQEVPLGEYRWKPEGLTPLGHRAAEAAGDENVWKRLLAKIGGPFASASVPVILEQLFELAGAGMGS